MCESKTQNITTELKQISNLSAKKNKKKYTIKTILYFTLCKKNIFNYSLNKLKILRQHIKLQLLMTMFDEFVVTPFQYYENILQLLTSLSQNLPNNYLVFRKSNFI